jgi:hypothetical protein
MTLSPGTRLGPYELVAPVGAAEAAPNPMTLVLNWFADIRK